ALSINGFEDHRDQHDSPGAERDGFEHIGNRHMAGQVHAQPDGSGMDKKAEDKEADPTPIDRGSVKEEPEAECCGAEEINAGGDSPWVGEDVKVLEGAIAFGGVAAALA